MASEIRFIVPAVPVAQPRPRATAINGKARMYEAKQGHAIHAFKASVRLAAQQAYRGAPLDGPLSLYLNFIFPRPDTKRWKTKPMPRYRHTIAPDVDNLIKGVCDALNKLAWSDDKQIVTVCCNKWVAAGDEQPHVVVNIGRI